MTTIMVGERPVGGSAPTYFVADIAANHDGDLGRARALIHLAAEAGADAAKFQNFRAERIVSGRGFADLPAMGHQKAWKRSVVEVYREASLPWEWTETLAQECRSAGIDYFSSPYDTDAVDMLDPFVKLFKIGSGDLTWDEMLLKIAGKGKPVLLATGASSIGEVQHAVGVVRSANPQLVLMQCNTNYTGSVENFRYVHLRVLQAYAVLFPDVVLGFSDHTPGHAAVLGAVALGARAVEKHFTDDVHREGPDHAFSLTPATWREMVDRTRELEMALGHAEKRVEENERETVVVQRRCLRAARALAAGTVLARADLEALRPAPADGIAPYDVPRVLGSRLTRALAPGEHLTWNALAPAV